LSGDSGTTQQLNPLQQALFGLKTLRARLDAVEHAKREPIAVIGAGCRFPGGATDLDAFWQLLHNGIDAIQEVPAGRWNIDALYDPDPDKPGKIATRYGGFLEGVDQFDATFFGISPREAQSMDPQQRLLLEVAWQAIENAGIPSEQLSGMPAGVFVGISSNDYGHFARGVDPREVIDAYAGTGNALAAAAGRLSYVLGLQGPSLSLDTACSSSLVAIHLACQSLRNGESAMALAGGVGVLLSAFPNMTFSRAHMLAPDGRCKTFDAAANGYVRSEGCGVVVLKRLSDAMAAGDRILAVIRSSAVNQDGPSGGLTVPNGLAQEALIRRALANGEVDPQQVSYVEAHGTGTALGDPIEVRALTAALGSGRTQENPLLVGSVKTNLGHLEAAAGIAGFLKVVLALGHEEIPPHLHFKTPNPYIDWTGSPVQIPTKPVAWPAGTVKRIAGVSSFGFTGTNAHVILEEAPASAVAAVYDRRNRPTSILTISAKTEPALDELSARFQQALSVENKAGGDTPPLQRQDELGDVCYTANAGRSHFVHRLAVIAATAEEAREKLASNAVLRGRAEYGSTPKVAFLFTGQGAQYFGMGRELFETQPAFRRTLEQCDEILRPHLEHPLLSVIYPKDGVPALLDETAYTQPALFAIEYALAELWRSWGIQPDAMLGHSVGEYVAACVAGVFGLEDGLRLIAKRGALMQALPRGRMAAIFAEQDRVAAVVRNHARDVSIAAVNGPAHVVISGRGEVVEAITQEFAGQGVEATMLVVSHAFHSVLQEPILEAFEQAAAQIRYRAPQLRLVSNLTGRIFAPGETPDAAYWRRHLRETVQFAAGIQTLEQQGCNAFVEVGPHPTLLGMGRRCVSKEYGIWLSSMRRGRTDWSQLTDSLATLYVRGTNVDWTGFDRDYPHRKTSIPNYPFQRERFWVDAKA
jgi:acyl transferase domain-containing protein